MILGIAADFRVVVRSRKLFETGLKHKLTEFNHTLDEYFDVHEKEFVHLKGNVKTFSKQPFVFCKDVKQLCQLAQDERDYEQVHLKFGVDGGGGFLKITLSLQNLTKDANNDKHRQFYRDGIAAKRFKDSGVKKIFLLGLVPHTQENYENLSKLWSLLKISEMKGTIATDLKIANILTGLMSHSSLHPCTWCTASQHLDQVGEYRTTRDCLRCWRADFRTRGERRRQLQ